MLEDYVDQFGMLAQKAPGRDGGDSIQRMGMYYTFLKWLGVKKDFKGRPLRQGLKESLRPLFRLGNIRRHPDPVKWYREFNRGSRDQQIPTVIAMAEHHLYIPLLEFFLRHLIYRGLLFASNTRRNHVYPTLEEHQARSTPDVEWNYKWKLPDLTLFEFWAIYVRAFRAFIFPTFAVLGWIFAPRMVHLSSALLLLSPLIIILLGDLETLIGSLIKVHWYAKDPTNADDNNHIMVLLFTKRLPTPISMLACRVYRNRPKAKWPITGYESNFGPQTALDYYFRNEKGDPPINELARSFLEKEL